ncbi:MAG TPA: hypothetical protein PKM78_12460 [Anaerolineae bacterium]|nr:hypothetical protein [Anaerolineae bacterium]HNU03684.1 hypothetical protein [Anaerolineae bacterium]
MSQTPPRWVRGYRLFFAGLALFAIVLQARHSFGNGFLPSNFFSFFTITPSCIRSSPW